MVCVALLQKVDIFGKDDFKTCTQFLLFFFAESRLGLCGMIYNSLIATHNRTMGVRRLITDKDGIFSSPLHSSARYYAMGEQGIYEVTNYARMADVDLTKGRDQTSAESEARLCEK